MESRSGVRKRFVHMMTVMTEHRKQEGWGTS